MVVALLACRMVAPEVQVDTGVAAVEDSAIEDSAIWWPPSGATTDRVVIDSELDNTDDGEGKGRAYAFLGPVHEGTQATDAVVVLDAPAGNRRLNDVLSVGDIDGDGYDDAAVLVYTEWDEGSTQLVFGGAELQTASSWRWFQASGDVDGDGISDVLETEQSNKGAVQLLHGAPRDEGTWTGDLGARWSGVEVSGYLGSRIGCGDMDADGLDDVAMSAFYAGDGLGTVYVASGGPRALGSVPVDSAERIWQGDDAYGLLGRDALEFGDVDGDGVDELVMSAHASVWEPALVVVDGDMAGTAWARDNAARWTTNKHTSLLSLEVADVDGDGTDDLVAAMFLEDRDHGRTAVWFGPLEGTLHPDGEVVRDSENYTVATAGDVDGQTSLLIGEPDAVVAGELVGAVFLVTVD